MYLRILGAIGLAWGLLILIGMLARGGPQGDGAYLAGQIIAVLFGLLMAGVGAYYLFRRS